MSGSKGKQNSQMSTRDIEEEEMAQELMEMEMYEEGMNYEQMKQILQVINESKDMARIEPDNRSSQEVTQYREEIKTAVITTKRNSLREIITEENSAPKPSYSYRLQSGRGSPATLGRKSTLEIESDEVMSVDSSDMVENAQPQRLSTDDESIADELAKENEKIIDTNEAINENRPKIQSKNSWNILSDSSENSQNSQNSHSGETKTEDNKSKKNQRIERWKLDPTNSVIDENDVPLKEKIRPVLKERIPYIFCHNRKVFEANIGEKVLIVLTHTLEEVADIWRSKHRPDVSEFQWGSPIKVGANIRSSDKKTIFEDADSPERCEYIPINPDCTQRRNMDRNCKRKAVDHIRDLIDDEVDSEDSSENIIELAKKQKKTTDKAWEPNIKLSLNKSGNGLTRKDKIFNNLQNSNKIEQSPVINDIESDEFDNDDLYTLRKKNETLTRVSSPQEYPRRVVPPNPTKPKAVRQPRNTKKKDTDKTSVHTDKQAILEKNKDSEISITRKRVKNPLAKQQTNSHDLEMNDKEISEELEDNQFELEIEVKPMPVKGLASKIHQGRSLLLEKKQAEERSRQAKMQEQCEAELKENMRKKDIIDQRYQKEMTEKQEMEAKEREVKVKEENWKKNGAARDRNRRRRQAEEKARSAQAVNGVVPMNEDDSDVDFIDNINARQKSMQELVQCPICQLEFSTIEIMNHAANCNQYDDLIEPSTSGAPVNGSDDDLTITNDGPILKCQVCSHFTTTNGIIYEEHVHRCMKRKKDFSQS